MRRGRRRSGSSARHTRRSWSRGAGVPPAIIYTSHLNVRMAGGDARPTVLSLSLEEAALVVEERQLGLGERLGQPEVAIGCGGGAAAPGGADDEVAAEQIRLDLV